MKRNIAILIAIVLLVLTSACRTTAGSEKTSTIPSGSAQVSTDESQKIDLTSTNDHQQLSSETEQQSLSPAAEQKEQWPEFSIDASNCTTWQLAYISLLQELCNREAPARTAHFQGDFDENDEELSDSYCLYDIDKDEIPEIFIRYGNCEAAYYTKVYTYKNETVTLVGMYHSGHSCLYTWPEENAVLYVWGHMGCAEMAKVSITGGELAFEEIFTENINETPEESYTDPSVIVPGACYLKEHPTMLNLPQYTPLTLPVYNYYANTSPNVLGGSTSNNAIQAVLDGNRKLYGISADGFGGDTGWISFEDYCQPGAASKYASQSIQIIKSGWVDFNHDGIVECILLMGEGTQSSTSDEIYVILSDQDGVVYAYCINYSCRDEVYQDGVFAIFDSDTDWSFGISFYKNQCYTYSKAHDRNVPAITWET